MIVSGVGLAILVLSLLRWKRKDLAMITFGATSLLYGLRLLVETKLDQYINTAPPQVLLYFIAFGAYVLPVPLSVFLLQLFGKGWKNSMLWVFRAATAFALIGILSDIIQAMPFSLERINNVLIIVWAFVVFKNSLWKGMKKTRELQVVLIGFVMFGLFAVNANLVELNLLPWNWSEEAIGYLFFLISLGYAVVHRFFNNEKQLIAVQQEMETARQIQFSILPNRIPAIEGLNITARYIPMTAVAGDFYDIVLLSKRQVCILVADVSGHGVGAALIASMIKVAFASQTQNMADPARVLSTMNRILCDKLESNFVTSGCLFINLDKGTMNYAGAGHPPMILHRRTNHKIYEFASNGILLGPFSDAKYEVTTMPIESGDRLILYTDGIIETTNASGSYFGDGPFKDFIETHAHLSAENFADTLLQHINQWSGKSTGESLDDDLTLIVIDKS